MTPDPKKPVTIEHLLHLKRSERPPEAFWTQFESELRAKQLAAIVGPRPWWRGLTLRGAGRMTPFAVGAAAAVFAAVFSLREVGSQGRSAAVAAPRLPAAVQPAPQPPRVSVATAAVSSGAAAHAAPTVLTAGAASVAPVSPRALVHAAGPRPTQSLVARLIQAPPLRTRFSDPLNATGEVGSVGYAQMASMNLGGSSPSATWASSGYSSGMQSEPLARTVTPADERRAALLSGPFPSNNAVWQTAGTTEDRSDGLSDERLYQAVRRLGVGGNRLLIRF